MPCRPDPATPHHAQRAGARLAPGSPTVESMTTSMPAEGAHAEPVVVVVVADLGEAEVVQAKLRASGIEAFVDDQLEGGILPVEGEPGVAILVRAADADATPRSCWTTARPAEQPNCTQLTATTRTATTRR